jgi:hypothetical protein
MAVSGNSCILCYAEDHITRPAVRVVKDDPLCATHLEREGYAPVDGEPVGAGTKPVVKVTRSRRKKEQAVGELCSRGCGKPIHRGECPSGSPGNYGKSGGKVTIDAEGVRAIVKVVDSWWEALEPVKKVRIFAQDH